MSMRMRVALEGKTYDVEVVLLPPVDAESPHKAERAAPRSPWHGLSTGRPGETTAPLFGLVQEVYVKVGDTLRTGDPVALLDVSAAYSAAPNTVIGAVRAAAGGVVREVLVEKAQLVDIGQVLVRCA